MTLNADLKERVALDTAHLPWTEEGHVRRRWMDRLDDIAPVGTALVALPAGPIAWPDLGEELLVLEGEIRQGHKVFPVGTYLAGKAATLEEAHCESPVLVYSKYRATPLPDETDMAVDVHTVGALGDSGFDRTPVRQGADGTVSIIRLGPGHHVTPHQHDHGEELFVLSGGFSDEYGSYQPGCWIRNPHGSGHAPVAGPDGAMLFARAGHLPAG